MPDDAPPRMTVPEMARRASVGSLVIVLQGVIATVDFSPKAPEDVTLTFLDVGQGDSVLIEFPSGSRMLVDGGGVAAGRFLDLRDESTFSIGENVLLPYLFSRRIRRLDTIVLTHAHHDHMDGLFTILNNFQVGEFWLGRNPMTPRYHDLLDQIQEKQIPIRLAESATFSLFWVSNALTERIACNNNRALVRFGAALRVY